MIDIPLPELRRLLAPMVAQDAGFDGWNDVALERAALRADTSLAIARLAFPAGAIDMIDAWFAHIDAVMRERLPPATLGMMKIRARIAALVETRLAIVEPDIEALRRALAILALPQHAARAARLGWRAADVMWRAAGDTATDYNHYTKRATLGAVYAATLLAMMADDSAGRVETRAFLSRRIDGIMRFEKTKAQFTRARPEGLSLARFLGRLRYPGERSAF